MSRSRAMRHSTLAARSASAPTTPAPRAFEAERELLWGSVHLNKGTVLHKLLIVHRDRRTVWIRTVDPAQGSDVRIRVARACDSQPATVSTIAPNLRTGGSNVWIRTVGT